MICVIVNVSIVSTVGERNPRRNYPNPNQNPSDDPSGGESRGESIRKVRKLGGGWVKANEMGGSLLSADLICDVEQMRLSEL